MRGVGCVISKVVRIENRADLISRTLVHGGEYCTNSRNDTAVIFDSLDCRLCGKSGYYRIRKNENIFALYHGNKVITEDYPAFRGTLRSDNVNRLVGVHVSESTFCQLTCKAGTDDLCAVKAEDSINDCIVVVITDKLGCEGGSLGQTGLVSGNINIVIDVAVACCKVTFAYTEKEISVLCFDFIRVFNRHN